MGRGTKNIKNTGRGAVCVEKRWSRAYGRKVRHSKVGHNFDGEIEWHLLCQTPFADEIALYAKGLVKLTQCVASKAMRFGNSFELWYNFAKLYRLSRYVECRIVRYIFDTYRNTESVEMSKIPV